MNQISANSIDWTEMLQVHRPWLLRVLCSRMGDRHAAEDALQEISLAVVRGNQTPSENSLPSQMDKVAPWLYRLAVRQAVDFHRRRNRKTEPQMIADVESLCEPTQPIDGLIGQEQQEDFSAAMESLPPALKEILILKYTQKWSYQQLATHLGIPVRSVESRLLKARTALRKRLNLIESDA